MILPFLPALGAVLSPLGGMITSIGGMIPSITATFEAVCATAGGGLLSNTLSSIGATLLSVWNPLEAVAKGPLTTFGETVIGGAMSFLQGSLKIVKSTGLGEVFGPLVE